VKAGAQDAADVGVAGYASFGGRHPDSAAVANALRHHGLRNPLTGQPFTEPAILGIAGGIGSGYSFCPSVFRYGMGSGVAIVARHLAWTFDGTFHRAALDRLGVKARTTESSTPGGGLKNLRKELQSGRPVIVWCARNLGYLEDDPTAGVSSCAAWSLVVHRLDDREQEAHVADLSMRSVPIPLAMLATARSTVCTHKNRTMLLDPPKAITAATVARAYDDGIRSCVDAQRKPRIKTFSLAGLEALSKVIANLKGRQGWLALFGKRMFWPLKDAFATIETAGTGGGLMRPMYAEFLEEAGAATGKRDLVACAAAYRKLGERWRAFADAALPSATKAFKKVKDLRRKRVEVFYEQGVAGLAQNRKSWEELAGLERDLARRFPLTDKQTRELLADLREQLVALVDGEREALERLAAAIA
jgi:hypothetical protein